MGPFIDPVKDCRDYFMDVLRNYDGEKKMNVALRKPQKVSHINKNINDNYKKIPEPSVSTKKLLSIGSDRLNVSTTKIHYTYYKYVSSYRLDF